MLKYLTILLSICSSLEMEREKGRCLILEKLLIRGNKVFIYHSHCILVYQLDGKFVYRIGNVGSGELQFNSPWGL